MSIPTNTLPAEFEAEHGSIDLADPALELDDDDEDDLDLVNSARSVWLCKVPKFLMEKWSQVEEEGVVLGRVRVYDEKDANGDPKIAVLLNGDEATTAASSSTGAAAPNQDVKMGRGPIGRPGGEVPTEYHLRLQNTSSKNLFVFGEKEEEDESTGDVGFRKRRRITSLAGTIQHECQLTPSLSSASASDSYRSIMRERQRKAAEPKRTVKVLDVDNATANRLASGVGLSGVKHRVASMVKTAKAANTGSGDGPGGRLVRMPRNELLDLLFTQFDQAPYWNLKLLNEHVKQPVTFLKEVLSEIGMLVPRGPYVGMWTLKEQYKSGNRETIEDVKPKKEEVGAGGEGDGEGEIRVKKEEGFEDEPVDEDDDEGEMEVVA